MTRNDRGRPTAGWVGSALLLLAFFLPAGEARAQGASTEEELGWSNSTDFSYANAKGNADTQALSLDNTLRHLWRRSTFQLKMDAFQNRKADDKFLLFEPGVTWRPGEDPPTANTRVIEPEPDTDADRLFIEGKYEHKVSAGTYWSAGSSWDRNEDAGIESRSVLFAGFGRSWSNTEILKFSTLWSLSYTDRVEEEPDPAKDRRFGGLRISWDFSGKLSKMVKCDSNFRGNMSLKDVSDYSMDITNAISVNMSSHLSLKVSLQWLFEGEPALEDADIEAQVVIVDPDGIPGNGDEFFETVESGGVTIEAGEGDIRKEHIDAIFKTSLTIKF